MQGGCTVTPSIMSLMLEVCTHPKVLNAFYIFEIGEMSLTTYLECSYSLPICYHTAPSIWRTWFE